MGGSRISPTRRRPLTRRARPFSQVTEVKPHIVNIGSMIEDMEIDMRSNMDNLYIQKTREIVNSMRRVTGAPKQGQNFTANLNAAVAAHGASRKVDG